MRIELRIDEDEIPRGYSGGMIYEDDDIYLSFCRGNTYDDSKPVVLADLKKLDLYIIGGKSMKESILMKTHKDVSLRKTHFEAVWEYILPKISTTLINTLIENALKEGFRKGQKAKSKEIRQALYMD